MTILSLMRQRWDLAPEEHLALPFDVGLATVNVRRIELACLLIIMNDMLEMLFRVRLPAMWFEFGVAGVFVLVTVWSRRWTDQRAKTILIVVFFAVMILNTESIAYQLAQDTGRIFGSYLTRILTFVLLFVLPPVLFAGMLAAAFVSFSYMVTLTPLSGADQVAAITSAAIVSVIALVTGWLIHAGRRSDHEQRRFIHDKNEELDHLMAITAHDLRSPLLGLRNLFDLAVRRAEHEPGLTLRVMQDGISSLNSMLMLVTRLLDAHYAEHAPLAPQSLDDLRPHVTAAARRIAPLAAASRIEVNVDLSPSALCARFDAGALGQILDNLLSNAVTHGPSESPLYITAAAAGDRAIISIEDRGAGIGEETRLVMFDKFVRGPSNHLNTKPGTGMGLFIASTLSSRIGGRLTYAPATPAGSVFRLSLAIEDR